jgi:hypothetical protein
MDSRIVTREIRREIWPALREVGFASFSGRSAWRQTSARTWLVNFQSFSSYFSLVDGCTTFSFALNLGIYVPAIESTPLAKPPDYKCHLRRKLSKEIVQTNYPRPDIWHVDPDGGNVLDVLADARSVLLGLGLPWFRRFDSDDDVLRLLVESDESEEVFGIGAPGSPARNSLIERFSSSKG